MRGDAGIISIGQTHPVSLANRPAGPNSRLLIGRFLAIGRPELALFRAFLAGDDERGILLGRFLRGGGKRSVRPEDAKADQQSQAGLSLDGLCERFGILPYDRHTAPGDAFLTAQVLLRLMRLAGRSGRGTLGTLCEPYEVDQ